MTRGRPVACLCKQQLCINAWASVVGVTVDNAVIIPDTSPTPKHELHSCNGCQHVARQVASGRSRQAMRSCSELHLSGAGGRASGAALEHVSYAWTRVIL